MRVGQRVEIRIDAYPDGKFTGHVESIQRGAGQSFAVLPAQNATGNFVKVVQRVPVKIVLDRFDTNRFPLGPGDVGWARREDRLMAAARPWSDERSLQASGRLG